MNFPVRPLQDRIVVQRDRAASMSAGGIEIPAGAREAAVRGEIIAVGPGWTAPNGKVEAMHLKVGQQVMFGHHAGVEIDVDGMKYLVMREEDVYGVIEE